jgi:hypothetical protein
VNESSADDLTSHRRKPLDQIFYYFVLLPWADITIYCRNFAQPSTQHIDRSTCRYLHAQTTWHQPMPLSVRATHSTQRYSTDVALKIRSCTSVTRYNLHCTLTMLVCVLMHARAVLVASIVSPCRYFGASVWASTKDRPSKPSSAQKISPTMRSTEQLHLNHRTCVRPLQPMTIPS